MLNLITILESLKVQSRALTDEENLYLDQLSREVAQAESQASFWRILEREGLNRIDGFDFGEDTMKILSDLRRAAMN